METPSVVTHSPNRSLDDTRLEAETAVSMHSRL
jgi:hypothetical protein